MKDFMGVKIALLIDDQIIVIQRDDKPGLRWPDMWDLPGGGREDSESPLTCMVREVKEELGIQIAPETIIWQKQYPAMHDKTQTAYFMVAKISQIEVDSIQFGNEGQGWKLMKIADFLADPTVIVHFKNRLHDYFSTLA